jgi:hypothetical protein
VELRLALEEQRSRVGEVHAAELQAAQERFARELAAARDDSRELLLKKLGQQHAELAGAHEAKLAALTAEAAARADGTVDEITRLAERHQGDLAATHREFGELLDATGAASAVAAGDARHARRYEERQNAKVRRALQVLATEGAAAADADELKKLALESMVERLREEVRETAAEADALEAEAAATGEEASREIEELHGRHADLQLRLEQAAVAHAEQTRRLQMSAEERAAADRAELARLGKLVQALEKQLAAARRDVAVASRCTEYYYYCCC